MKVIGVRLCYAYSVIRDVQGSIMIADAVNWTRTASSYSYFYGNIIIVVVIDGGGDE